MRRGPVGDSAFVQQDREIGTDKYRTPEIVMDLGFNKKTDIWVMGCILYQSLAYKSLFETDYDVSIYSTDHPQTVPKDLVPLDSFVDMESVDWRAKGPIPTTVNQMFAATPDQRPDAGELLEMVFKPLLQAGVGPNIYIAQEG